MSFNKAGVPFKQGVFNPINAQKYNGSMPIVFRSSWELAMMQYLDRNTACISWSSESVIIPYFDPVENKQRRYFIDFAAVFQQGAEKQTFVIEVKPYRETIPPKASKRKKSKTLLRESMTYATNVAKWKAAEAWCLGRGYKFIIVTEKVLFGK